MKKFKRRNRKGPAFFYLYFLYFCYYAKVKKLPSAQVKSFQKKVWDFYYASGRHDLAWRPQAKKKLNSYFVVVSELMLQQTQVSRVIPKFKLWMDTFPDWNTLAQAPLSQVLSMWQGLGYARRAKFLHTIAQFVVDTKTRSLPKTIEELEMLSGIGRYTARAIATFAYNQSHALIETNIRTVYIHHFFKTESNVLDQSILFAVEQTLDRKNPREWMYALMDYGSYLKSQGLSHNIRSAHNTKQKPFLGSVREVRGAILKILSIQESFTVKDVKNLEKKFGSERVKKAIAGLVKDNLIVKKKNTYCIC